MKKLFTLIAASLIVVILFAQSPEKMNFQAVVRDNNNNLITNTVVGIRITILQNSTPVYFETQKPVTNSNGLITIAFGGEAGFNKIDWANGPFFIKSEIDPKGGTNYTITGTSQLMSVPYAFHAQTASYLIGEYNQILKSTDKGVPSQNWSLFGNSKSNPLKDKLGTTDNADMIFVTNNMERLRIKGDGNITTGNLAIDGDLTVKKNVFLNTSDGSTTLNGDLTVENKKFTNLTGDLKVDGSAIINGTTTMNGKASMGGGADFTGSVMFKDNVDIFNSLTVGGVTTLNNSLTSNGPVTLNKSLLSNDQVTINTEKLSDKNAYPLIVEGSTNGISVRVNTETANSDNNFITFWNNNSTIPYSQRIVGRIEGQTYKEKRTTPEFIYEEAKLTANGIARIANVVASCLASAVDPSAVGIAIADAVLAAADIFQFNFFELTSYGVSYESGSGDYAEWLEKVNANESFYPGDIVGVKAGKISYDTQSADHYMVISSIPIVLGNMPETGRESEYEKVAFLGQVPVKVIGKVNEGDYIIPSGLNDGYGKAVSPDEIEISDLQKIVGVAWTGSNNLLNYVNVAVGLNANDVTRHTLKLEKKIEEQANEIEGLKARFTQIDKILANIDSNYIALNQSLNENLYLIPQGGNEEDTITTSVIFYELTDDDLTKGLEIAKSKLKDKGVDVDNHPLFKQLEADPDFLGKIKKEYNDEIDRKVKMNNDKGIKTKKIKK